ncbi:MAG: 2-amino-4-hydroxy-6-hydroxymethyldihydropteridine diphosphokinase [Armatimonadetes bacterium]|nr:2-amino-4-hydroxy-6-hydroxymethyldihydropteridine diphosphokinase [Armatimonadota bacterium]
MPPTLVGPKRTAPSDCPGSAPARRRVATAFLGLGSNLGDRLRNLELTVERLRPIVLSAHVSPIYETAYIGLDHGPQPSFLNAVVRVATDLSPIELLSVTSGIEALGGKLPTDRWRPRTLDIDVLLYGDVTMDCNDLTLPHPRMWDRAFVLFPLRDLAPGLTTPSGLLVGEAAAALERSGQQVRRIRDANWPPGCIESRSPLMMCTPLEVRNAQHGR